MGDNFFIGDRNGVRTPMQWSPDRNAGFSRADPQRLYLPPVMDAVYGYQSTNVEAQSRDPSSLLSWTKRMLAVRKTSRAFGRGARRFLRPGNRKILAYLREIGDDTILCVANLSRSAQPVELNLSSFKGRVPVEMLGRTAFPPIGELPYLLTISAYGFYWFRLATDAEVPSWHEQIVSIEERPVLVLFDGWTSLFRERVVPGRIGIAFGDELFCRSIGAAMAARKEIAMAQGKLQFRPTAAFARLAGTDFNALPVARPRGSRSNTVVNIGERLMLKGYRRLRTGLNPELEMGRYLTEVAHYPNFARLAGALEYFGKDGETCLLAMLQGYVANQGDGWTHSLEYVQRYL